MGIRWLYNHRMGSAESSCQAAIERSSRLRFAASLLIGLAVISSGCNQLTAVQEAEVRQAFGVPADLKLIDLGAVELRPGVPKHRSLGAGRECAITATILTNGLVQLDLVCEPPLAARAATNVPPRPDAVHAVFRPDSVSAGWRICLFPSHQPFAVALQPKLRP